MKKSDNGISDKFGHVLEPGHVYVRIDTDRSVCGIAFTTRALGGLEFSGMKQGAWEGVGG